MSLCFLVSQGADPRSGWVSSRLLVLFKKSRMISEHVALLCLRGQEESRASKDRRETRGRQGYQVERGSLEDQDLWCVSMDKTSILLFWGNN